MGIRKLNANHFVVEVQFNHREETVTVHLTEVAGAPEYMDFSKPVIQSVVEENGILTVKTDQETNLVIFITPKGKGIRKINAVRRSNTMSTQHKINISDLDRDKYDMFIGVISSQDQSALELLSV